MSCHVMLRYVTLRYVIVLHAQNSRPYYMFYLSICIYNSNNDYTQQCQQLSIYSKHKVSKFDSLTIT